ncbi:MAG: IS110 family transposase [Phycisphaerales bacterium]
MITKILAIDLGKAASVMRFHCTDGRPDHTFTVPTTAQALHDQIAASGPDLVIIEACAIAWWVHDLIAAMDIKVIVTANNGPGWRWKNVRNKSDRSDAAKIIKMYLSQQLEEVHVPARNVRQWRGLILHRQDLVHDLNMFRNRIIGLLTMQNIVLTGSRWTRAWMEQLRALATDAYQSDDEQHWRLRLVQDLESVEVAQRHIDRIEEQLSAMAAKHEAVALLQREPGVGPRLAETVVAVIDDPLRFKSGRQVACYAGLTPRHWSSGQTERSGGISKQGNKILRTLLVEVSWLGLRHNPWLAEIHRRIKRDTAGRGKIAIVAAARRLLIKLWAIWRDFERERRGSHALAAA